MLFFGHILGVRGHLTIASEMKIVPFLLWRSLRLRKAALLGQGHTEGSSVLRFKADFRGSKTYAHSSSCFRILTPEFEPCGEFHLSVLTEVP